MDRAALDAASQMGIETGGWCPPGRVAEDGQIPAEYNLIETEEERSKLAPDIPRSQRSLKNVRFSDATLVLLPGNTRYERGTEWTVKCARHHRKPCIVVNPYNPDVKKRIIEWLNEIQVEVLNVAGPSEKTSPGIYDRSYKLLTEIFNR